MTMEGMRCRLLLLSTVCSFIPQCDLLPDNISNKSPSHVIYSGHREQGIRCQKGQHYRLDIQGNVTCVPCPDNTYMDLDLHIDTECIPCSRAEEHNHEVMSHQCTRESDTVIECANDYFKDINKQCKRCRNCQYESHRTFVGVACTRDSDTVCCEKEGMHVEWAGNGHAYKCVLETTNSSTTTTGAPSENCEGSVQRHYGCLAGEYFAVGCDYHNRMVSCKKCLDGTFMNVSNHTQRSCTPCTPPNKENTLVVSLCNATQNVVYGDNSVSFGNPILLTAFIIVVVIFALLVCIMVCIACYKKRRPVRRYRDKLKNLLRKGVHQNPGYVDIGVERRLDSHSPNDSSNQNSDAEL